MPVRMDGTELLYAFLVVLVPLLHKRKKPVNNPLANFWSGKWDSNPRPSAWEADALPTELLPLVNLVKCLLRTFVDI